MSDDADSFAPSASRARWILLALLPGLVCDIMFAGWYLAIESRSDVLVSLSTGLLYGAALLPLAAPFYLVDVGRRYTALQDIQTWIWAAASGGHAW